MEYTITLEPQLDAYLRSTLEAGRYKSVDEAIRDAVRRLAESEQLDERLLESIAQADAGDTIDIDDVFEELNRELADMEKRRNQ